MQRREIHCRMNADRQEQRRLRWLLLGLTLFAYAWRVHRLGAQSLWRDEVDAVFMALPHGASAALVDAGTTTTSAA